LRSRGIEGMLMQKSTAGNNLVFTNTNILTETATFVTFILH